jgi:hypothetical protein
VGSTKVRINAGLRKALLINCAGVGKRSHLAIRIVRRTKLPVDSARIAAGNTMATAGPSPPNRVAHMNVEFVRRKCEALPDRDIESPMGRATRARRRGLGTSAESELAAGRR